MELYTRLLYRFPWKYEYRTLKTYNGFYSTMIDNLMPCNREIFKMLGYTPNNESILEGNAILELAIVPTSQTLLTIGFDCLVASAQCKLRRNKFSHNMQFRTVDYETSDNHKQFTKYNKLYLQEHEWASSSLEKTLSMSGDGEKQKFFMHCCNPCLYRGCKFDIELTDSEIQSLEFNYRKLETWNVKNITLLLKPSSVI
ncbi:Hypothetical predicted protein [Octopus vulgaris]|uniref:Spermatogenesis-associated protein 2 PUB-like domain-containing protein n=1 Tax=Octopus vulgaris TaxID=6645 RepID=A0AA36B1A4_OCTVU|nr:Hypothetical predicted protein [Octopus vulgaris]